MKRNLVRAITNIEVILMATVVCLFAMAAAPNFLEMQVHSGVARVNNDLKKLAMAMEAYRADNATYPAHYACSPILPHTTSTSMDTRLLTTPVAYMSSFPSDIFRGIANQSTGSISSMAYRVYALGYTPRVNYPGYNRDYSVFPKTAWMTWSIGPDWVTNTGGYFPLPTIISNEALAVPRVGVDRNGYVIAGSGYYGLRYDPTNGTVSWGDIYRFSAEATRRIN